MSTDAQRVRSPADFLRLAVAVVVLLVVLVLEWLFGDTLVAFASDLLRGLDALPSWMLTAIGIGVLAAALTAGAPWLSRRWRQAGWVAVIGLDITRTLTSDMSFGCSLS